MAAPRLQKSLASLKNRHRERLPVERKEKRRLHLESLEDRRMMAVGPTLVAIIPNNDDFLQTGDIFDTAPRELTFRLAQGNSIDANSLSTGMRVIRAGTDHSLGTADDVMVTPGFLGLGDTSREVIMRFAGNLPDDAYRVTLV